MIRFGDSVFIINYIVYISNIILKIQTIKNYFNYIFCFDKLSNISLFFLQIC